MPEFPVTLIHADTGAEYPVHNEGELANLAFGPDQYLLKEPTPGVNLRVYEAPNRGDWPNAYQPPRRAALSTEPPPAERATADPARPATRKRNR